MNQPLFINSMITMCSNAIIIKVTNIFPNQFGSHITITADVLDWQSGIIMQSDVCFDISLAGLKQNYNYSVGESFGAIISSFGNPLNNGYSFNLRLLQGSILLGFVHYRNTRNGSTIQTINDLYPIQALNQFEWNNH